MVLINEVALGTLGPVSTRWVLLSWASKPSRFRTSYTSLLSLEIPLWLNAVTQSVGLPVKVGRKQAHHMMQCPLVHHVMCLFTPRRLEIAIWVASRGNTSGSAVAKRPRDASGVSVCFVASIMHYLERNFLLLVTSASDLSVRPIRFRSVVFGVTSSLAVSYTRFTVHRDCV